MTEKHPLPQTTPEAIGVPSEAVERFIRQLEGEGLCMHSVLMVRHGKITAEAYWKPFTRDTKHRMYSVSKSFVSIAVGILIGEGKLALDDRIDRFFPDKIPAGCHPWTLQTTVRDLLMMAAPHDQSTYSDKDPDWADTFFQTEPNHQPGRIFSYNTSATVMLLIIVKRITGVEFVEYLQSRLFEPVGMSEDIRCIETPCGHEWGGSGILCTPRDLARFALICLNQGRHGGRSLVPEDYVVAATSRQIDNTVENGDRETQYGYGYQFWRTRHNGFACIGMGGQLAICLPDQDFVLVTTADTQSMSSGISTIFRTLWTVIFPYLDINQKTALPENPAACDRLMNLTANLSLLTVNGAWTSALTARITGKIYQMADNRMGIKHVRFTFDVEHSKSKLDYDNATGSHALLFGFGHQERQQFPENHYYGSRIGIPLGRGYDCHASAAWVTDHSLLIICYLTDDYFGTLNMNFVFDDQGETVTVLMRKAAEWFLDEYNGFADGARI